MSDAEAGTSGTGWFTPVAAGVSPVDLNTGVPHPARMYDYYLGGKENFPADRETAEQAIAAFPNTRNAARQNRAFLIRAVRHLVGEVGIRQFLDIGTKMFREIYFVYGIDRAWRYRSHSSDPCPPAVGH
ncbi:SAM-dependent methyltransferase [Frankia sp. QA3]|uniref:SAM-dependent methyltransferase n=1 Tax=Frankia sp. QA3 TaxID=710111 RepID=UPI000269CA46|nr:Protein of unknown function (DUF574) [Frankia sp. QA3]